jgi:protein-S-isoprenylcysteine O-methyltransferase Ste14
MAVIPEEDERIIQAFAKRKKIQYLLTIPLALVIIFFVINRINPDFAIGSLTNDTMSIIILVLIIAAILVSLINWRCPNCNKYLGSIFGQKQCPSCGKKLQRD